MRPLLAVWMVVATACTQRKPRAAVDAGPATDEEYAVLGEAIAANARGWQAAGEWIVSDATAATWDGGKEQEATVDSLTRRIAGLEHQAALSYVERKQQHVRLTGRFSPRLRITLMKRAEVEATAKFFAQHPNVRAPYPGIFTVSRPGFNADHTQALVYVDYVCGERCGRGYLLLLQRRADRWIVTVSHMVWAS